MFTAYGTQNMAVFKNRSCVEPAKHILTETESALGPVVDIRMKGKAWYYDPARPVVVHLVAKEEAVDPDGGHDAVGKELPSHVHRGTCSQTGFNPYRVRKLGTMRKSYPTREERTLPPTSVRRKSRP